MSFKKIEKSFNDEKVLIYIFDGEINVNVNYDNHRRLMIEVFSGDEFFIKYAKFLIDSSGDVKNFIVFIVDKENKITAHGSGGIYSTKTLGRSQQWDFGENRERSAWIDHLWSNGGGRGTYIMHELEGLFLKYKSLLVKKNVYVLSIRSAASFYAKCGYNEIRTPHHKDDTDYPNVFWNEVGIWYAKPLNAKLDRETFLFDFENKTTDMFFDLCRTGRIEVLDFLNNELFDTHTISEYVGEFPESIFAACAEICSVEICKKGLYIYSNEDIKKINIHGVKKMINK